MRKQPHLPKLYMLPDRNPVTLQSLFSTFCLSILSYHPINSSIFSHHYPHLLHLLPINMWIGRSNLFRPHFPKNIKFNGSNLLLIQSSRFPFFQLLLPILLLPSGLQKNA